MEKIKIKKGISLIVLVITIIVMAILAGAIILSLDNSGIIDKAEEATNEYQITQEKEELQIVLYEYNLQSLSQADSDLEEYLIQERGKENVQLNTDKSVTVTMQSGNKYVLTEESITLLKDMETPPEPFVLTISLDKETLIGEIDAGTTSEVKIGEIVATVNDEEATLVWSVSPENSGITLKGEGNKREVYATKVTETDVTITVSYTEDTNISKNCTVIVLETVTRMSFVIDDITYEAGEGMTWNEWLADPRFDHGPYVYEGKLIGKDTDGDGQIDSYFGRADIKEGYDENGEYYAKSVFYREQLGDTKIEDIVPLFSDSLYSFSSTWD